MRKKNNSGLWQYLDSSGVLESGNDEQIKTAKKQYRKLYYSTHKKQCRQRRHEFTIGFTKRNGEYQRIIAGANKHHLKPSVFIRKASLAYLEMKFLVPDERIIVHLEQLLSDCLNEIKSIVAIKEKYFWHRDEKIEAIEKQILKLEDQVNKIFKSPPLISSNDHQDQITQATNI